MSDRDKIAEIIREARINASPMAQLGYPEADALINHGAILLPYKVGAKVYTITSTTSDNKNLYIFEDVITQYYIGCNFPTMCFENHFGITNYNWDRVFLTREEAEKKLEEMRK